VELLRYLVELGNTVFAVEFINFWQWLLDMMIHTALKNGNQPPLLI
jgi:hypothetical protein